MRPLYLLVFLSALNHTALGGVRVIVSLYALELGATAFTVGVLMALFSVLPMVTSVSIGRFVDRAGARKPMLAGCTLLAASIALDRGWRAAGRGVVERDGEPLLVIDLHALIPGGVVLAA